MLIEKLMATEEAMATDAGVSKTRKKPGRKPSKANGKAVTNGRTKVKAKTTAKRAARKVDPDKLDIFGFRKTSKKAQAAVMYANKKTKGATLDEVREELDSTQFNLLPEVEKRGWEVRRSQEDGKGSRKVTRYWIILK